MLHVRVGNNAPEYYIMDGMANIAVITTNQVENWNILAGGTVAGRMESDGTTYFYTTDHLGSTRAVTDASGTAIEGTDYYPFGLVMSGRKSTSGDSTKEGFTSKERDAETGLDYFGARFYMPSLGRWNGVDPLSDKYPSHSPYNYVMNNPLSLVDPDGRDIVLSGDMTDDERKTILDHLNTLTDDSLVTQTRDDGSVQVKIGSLAESGTEGKVNGTRLLRRLNSSEKTVTICAGEKNEGGSVPENSANAVNGGVGNDAMVSFNDSSNPLLHVESENSDYVAEERPSFIALAHELIHADRAMRGVIDNVNGVTIRSGHHFTSAEMEEVQTIGIKTKYIYLSTSVYNGPQRGDITENSIRAEHGLPDRIDHD